MPDLAGFVEIGELFHPTNRRDCLVFQVHRLTDGSHDVALLQHVAEPGRATGVAPEQAVHTDAPDEAADVFVAQGVQFVLAVPAAKVPGEHNLHAVAPVVLEKEPCGHGVGSVAPKVGFVPMGAK